MDGGAAALALLDEISQTAATSDIGLAGAVADLKSATEWMVAAEPNERFAGATSYLRGFALALGGHYLALASAADPSRAAMTTFFAQHFLPQVGALCVASTAGSDALYAMSPEEMIA